MEQEINRHKYPRTFHLPWSEGKTDDDKTLSSTDHFEGEMVVITEKLDGENTSLYSDGYVHARSMDAAYHGSREWIRADWGAKYWDLPDSYRICGENCFAVHSIKYDNLESYFYGFSVWEGDTCLDWEETTYILESFNYPIPRVLYHGVWDEDAIRALNDLAGDKVEGYVVRKVGSFKKADFQKNIAKYVRKGHVQTDEHWMKKPIEKNVVK